MGKLQFVNLHFFCSKGYPKNCIPFSGISFNASFIIEASAIRASLALTALAMAFPAVWVSTSAIKTTSFPDSGFAPSSCNCQRTVNLGKRREALLGLNTRVLVMIYSAGSSEDTVPSCSLHSVVFFAGPWLTKGAPSGINFSTCALVLAIFCSRNRH